MHEDISATLTEDESITFFIIETLSRVLPLDPHGWGYVIPEGKMKVRDLVSLGCLRLASTKGKSFKTNQFRDKSQLVIFIQITFFSSTYNNSSLGF